MYSLIIREDTIRIPAEYIRAGRKLEEHIDELAHVARLQLRERDSKLVLSIQ